MQSSAGRRSPVVESRTRPTAVVRPAADGAWAADVTTAEAAEFPSRIEAERFAIELLRAAGGGDLLLRDGADRFLKRIVI